MPLCETHRWLSERKNPEGRAEHPCGENTRKNRKKSADGREAGFTHLPHNLKKGCGGHRDRTPKSRNTPKNDGTLVERLLSRTQKERSPHRNDRTENPNTAVSPEEGPEATGNDSRKNVDQRANTSSVTSNSTDVKARTGRKTGFL